MALSLQAKPSQAKPNKTYYQMDKSSLAKGGIRGLRTPFLEFLPEEVFFVEYCNFFQYLQGAPFLERMVAAWYDLFIIRESCDNWKIVNYSRQKE